MSWIVPALSIIICSTVILTIAYSYLYYIEKKIFAGIYTISWIFYLIAQIISLITISGVRNDTLVIINYSMFLISAILLIWGTYSFLNKKMPKWCVVVNLLAIIWMITSTILKKTFVFAIFPIGIVLGLSTIWVGIVFLHYSKSQKWLSRVLGGSFILWGVHKMDYPFFSNIPWFAPWGYMISAGFSLMITIAFIFIYFEKIRAELIQAQKEIVASENDKIKTEFFANISHELKTPLNVILASTQLLELYNKNNTEISLMEKTQKNVLMIKQNVFRLLKLINNLIDITRVNTGFFELQLSNYNVVSIIEEITLSVVDYVESRNISLEFDTDIEEKVICCDKEKIERIMLNLLSNAVKFTNPGGKITVNVSDGEDFINISVKDNGIGIVKDNQEMIFERFKQVDKSLSRNKEGSGIGLSLVKSLVEMHGGKVHLRSEYGQGSEFILDIPVKVMGKSILEDKFEDFSVRKTDIEFSDIY